MSTQYSYTKLVDVPRLTLEIQQSSIVTALDYISVLGLNVSIYFKADLSTNDKTTLDNIIANHSGQPLPVNVSKPVTVTTPVDTLSMCEVESDYRPNSSRTITDSTANLKLDCDWNLIGRSAVFVDEGSFRTDFSTPLLVNLTGTINFTKDSNIVTGINTKFLSELALDYYIKLSTDTSTCLTQIKQLISDTQVLLEEGYLGNTGTDTGQISRTYHDFGGTGSSITVDMSTKSLNSGIDASGYAYIQRNIDYCPLCMYADLQVTTRQVGQEIILGLADNALNPEKQALIIFTGVSDTKLIFRTGTGTMSCCQEETIITLSGQIKTSDFLDYEINVLPNKCTLVINGQIRASHTDRIPFPYDVLQAVCCVKNTTIVASNPINLSTLFVSDVNILQISNNFIGDPLRVQIVSSPDLRGKGFIDGKIETASTGLFIVRGTNYTEQSTNGQRSIVSSSTDDSASGIGARSVKITYFNSTINGPYQEVIILNGTTAVNTIANDICYIEKMEILTIGSHDDSAIGDISLYTGIDGSGTIIGILEANQSKTFWCHHYVADGLTCNITGVTASTSGTNTVSGGRFHLKCKNLLTANSINNQISDMIRVGGAQPSISRNYGTPILIEGPAVIIGYVLTDSDYAYTSYLSFDFYEE